MVKRDRKKFFHFRLVRGVIKKFVVVLAFISAFVFMLFSKSENVLFEQASSVANEIVSSAVNVLVLPASVMVKGYEYLRSLRKIDQENQQLREENQRLIIINARKQALEVENRILARMLNYQVPPEASFITAKVVAEEGSAFTHSLTVYIGGNKNVRKGQVVLGDKGVIGRVEKTGSDYAKIFLVNDINSKIPVITEKERVKGVLSGENAPLPKMIFIPFDAKIEVGDRIVTSGIGGVFPAGLPIGQIVSKDKTGVMVRPYDHLSRLEYVQIVDYKLPDPASEFLK